MEPSWWVGVSRQAWAAAVSKATNRMRVSTKDLRALATTSMARHQRTRAQKQRDGWDEEV